jgi:hypothetical protein
MMNSSSDAAGTDLAKLPETTPEEHRAKETEAPLATGQAGHIYHHAAPMTITTMIATGIVVLPKSIDFHIAQVVDRAELNSQSMA